MKFNLFTLLLAATAFSAPAITIGQWTFETPPADLSNSAASPNVVADVGNGTASGLHLSAGTDWTTPVGNGSANSFSANEWGLGNYWQFRVDTTGYSDITVSFDQASSNTGPRDYSLRYSTDGSFFTPFASYAVLANATPNPTWNGTTHHAAFSFSHDLSSVGALDNTSAVYFRLVNTTTVSANGGTVAGTGTDRIDNFTVSGLVIAAVPDSSPGWVGWICLVAVVALFPLARLQAEKKPCLQRVRRNQKRTRRE